MSRGRVVGHVLVLSCGRGVVVSLWGFVAMWSCSGHGCVAWGLCGRVDLGLCC
jgi:hypothetical protein